MNYDMEITKLVGMLKSDKSIIQPWRNKSIARLEEAQAFIRMGKTSAPEPKGDPMQIIPGPVGRECICHLGTGGTRNPQCPTHGI